MKYTANIVKAVLSAMQNHPEHTFWFCTIETEFDADHIAVVTCTNGEGDGQTFAVHLFGNEVACFIKRPNADTKWYGTAMIDKMNRDTFMMWLGCKLSKMYSDSMKYDPELDAE